jgi:outer membrane protein TolC
VEVEVYRAFLNYNKANDRITISKKAVEQADENYRTTKEKYEAQVATSTELIDAEVSLLQAKTNLTNALVDFQMAKMTLDKSVGRKIY